MKKSLLIFFMAIMSITTLMAQDLKEYTLTANGNTSNSPNTGTSYSIDGTYVAGGGNVSMTVNGKTDNGVKLRTGRGTAIAGSTNSICINVNEGYTITALSFMGRSNYANTITLNGIYVDGDYSNNLLSGFTFNANSGSANGSSVSGFAAKEKIEFAVTTNTVEGATGTQLNLLCELTYDVPSLSGFTSTDIVYVFNSTYSTYCGIENDPVYSAIAANTPDGYKLNKLDVNGYDASEVTKLKGAGLIISSEANSGTDAFGIAMKDLAGSTPMINLKTFYYGSGRWDWGTATNPSPRTGTLTATDSSLKLFEGVIFNGSDASLFNQQDVTSNMLQGSTVSGTTTLATVDSYAAIFTKDKFCHIGMSYDDILSINKNGINIIINAMNIMLAGGDFTQKSTKAALTNVAIDGEALTAVELGQLSSNAYTKKVSLTAGSMPVITASATNGGSVSITQPTESNPVATIVVSNADGSEAATYTINIKVHTVTAVDKKLYDKIVSNGEELVAALDEANSRADQTTRYRIFVKPGTIQMPATTTDKTVTVTLADKVTKKDFTFKNPIHELKGSNVSIIGADYNTTVITNTPPTETYIGEYGEASVCEGIGISDVLDNSGTSNYFQGVMIKTNLKDGSGRDIAFNDKGNKTIFKNAALWGYQDTYVSNSSKSRFYFENGVIRGRTDYICGKGDVWYEQVNFQQVKSGYLAVPSVPTKYGYILNRCTITGSESTAQSGSVDGTWTLGRPWGSGTPIALYLSCTFEVKPSTSNGGWSDMSGGYPKQFATYNAMDANGKTISISSRKSWTDKTGTAHDNVPTLTKDEADFYTIETVMGTDGWEPDVLCEQVEAPVLTVSGGTISWNDRINALLYAIVKDGEIIDFTTATSYSPAQVGSYAVRAANEMGGLGDPSEAVTVTTTDITSAATPAATTPAAAYNIAGQRVAKTSKGIVISGGKKYMK